MRRFWDIRLVAVYWLWNAGYGSLKGIGTDTYRSATYDFLLTFHSNHGPISYRFRDRRRFQSKIAKKSYPLVLCVPAEAELGIGAGDQKLEWWGYWAEEEVWRFLQPFGYNAPTCLRDGQTDTGRQQWPRLHISSRGKNHERWYYLGSISLISTKMSMSVTLPFVKWTNVVILRVTALRFWHSCFVACGWASCSVFWPDVVLKAPEALVTIAWLHSALAAAQCIVIGLVCLQVGGCVCLCGGECYHDNSKLRASILTKLGP